MQAFILLITAGVLTHTFVSTTVAIPKPLNRLQQWKMLDLAARTSSNSSCISLYEPQLQNVANDWSIKYDTCLSNATRQTTTMLNTFDGYKANMTAVANDMMAFMALCLQKSAFMDFFNCFAEFSKRERSNYIALSFNASMYAVGLTQQLQSIAATNAACINHSESSYVKDAAKVYNAIDYCLRNGPPDYV